MNYTIWCVAGSSKFLMLWLGINLLIQAVAKIGISGKMQSQKIMLYKRDIGFLAYWSLISIGPLLTNYERMTSNLCT